MLSAITYHIYRLPVLTVLLIMLLTTPVFGAGIALLKRKWPDQVRTVSLILSDLYIFLILCLTLFNREGGAGQPAELIPFSVFIRAQEQPEYYRELVMNIFLFWPVGLLLPHGLEKCKRPVLLTVVFACILSVIIETVQYYSALGLAETDDVIANTLGTVIGTGSAAQCRVRRSKASQC